MNTISPKQQAQTIALKDNSKRSKIVLIIFSILTGVTLIGLFTGYNELQLLKRIQNGAYIFENEIYISDLLQRIIGLLQSALFIASVVLFLSWFRRAYGNLHRLGNIHPDHKETMAIWSWIIPIISFYRPMQIMKEIWKETRGVIRKLDTSYNISNGELIIGVWWTLFIVSNFLGNYIIRTAFNAETIEQLILSSQANLIADILKIVEALILMMIIIKLSRMESKMQIELKRAAEFDPEIKESIQPEVEHAV